LGFRRQAYAALVASVALTLAAWRDSRVRSPARLTVADRRRRPEPSVAAVHASRSRAELGTAGGRAAPRRTQRRCVARWIGNTVFVRRDGIAEIWRFAADSCFSTYSCYREATAARSPISTPARAPARSALPRKTATATSSPNVKRCRRLDLTGSQVAAANANLLAVRTHPRVRGDSQLKSLLFEGFLL